MANPYLQVDGLTKSFGDLVLFEVAHTEVTTIHDASFVVAFLSAKYVQ